MKHTIYILMLVFLFGSAVSAQEFFGKARTEEAEVKPKKIEQQELGFTELPEVRGLTKNEGVIVWLTNVEAKGEVEWGEDSTLGNKSLGKVGTKQLIKLFSLKAGTRYYFRAISKKQDLEIISKLKAFDTPTPDIAIMQAYFPARLKLAINQKVKVVTKLNEQPLDQAYHIYVYRDAYSRQGLRLNKEPIKIGAATVAPHPVDTSRTVEVPIFIPPLRGINEAFDYRNELIVQIEAQETELNLDNNTRRFTVLLED